MPIDIFTNKEIHDLACCASALPARVVLKGDWMGRLKATAAWTGPAAPHAEAITGPRASSSAGSGVIRLLMVRNQSLQNQRGARKIEWTRTSLSKMGQEITGQHTQ